MGRLACPSTMAPVTVAFDVGPLIGARTGIGVAVAHLREALERRSDVQLAPYLTSYRARDEAGTTRLPLPAAVAHRLWSRMGHPQVDRWLTPADVIHGTNYVVPPSQLPRLVSVYDCWFLRQPDLAHPDVRRAGKVLRRAVEHGAVVHASSNATAAAVRTFMPTADVRVVHLAPVPLPPPADTPPIADLVDRRFVVAIGTLERRKNLPTLIAAFARLAGDHDDVLLVLAGNYGDDRAAIDAAISAAGPDLANRILLTGRIEEPARSWLLHHADVLAYPSLDEGFGFPLLDAMQAGVPIVASDAGSIPEVAGPAALLASATDVAAIADALATALSDESRRADLVAAGRQQLATFSWDAAAEEMAAIYHELARGTNG